MPARSPSFLVVMLTGVLAVGCTVPDIVFSDGGLDASVEASVDTGPGDDASGVDSTQGGEAGDDGGGDGGDASDAGCGADACCGSIPCSGDCSQANCATCISKCGGGGAQQCCVKQMVTCHPTTSACP